MHRSSGMALVTNEPWFKGELLSFKYSLAFRERVKKVGLLSSRINLLSFAKKEAYGIVDENFFLLLVKLISIWKDQRREHLFPYLNCLSPKKR